MALARRGVHRDVGGQGWTAEGSLCSEAVPLEVTRGQGHSSLMEPSVLAPVGPLAGGIFFSGVQD